MVIDFPFEIWDRIASFLPSVDLKKLYSVNHALFEIAMKEKYRTVLLHSSHDVVQALRLLMGSITSQHVRCLRLELHVIRWIMSPRWSRCPTFFSKAIRSRGKTADGGFSQKQIPDLFGCLLNLEILELAAHRDQSSCHELEVAMQLVTPALTLWGTLRVLKLNIMVEGYQFLSPVTVFPLLEHLSISLSHGYSSTDHSAILENVLAPFVNNHHTLRIFHLSTVHSVYTFDISAFLLKLQHLPQLKGFGLWYPFVSIRQSSSAGLSHMLRVHSQHLLELTLHAKGPVEFSMYPTREQWYMQEFLRVELPKLQVLDLDIELYDDIIQTVLYLGQFRRSLTSLRLLVNMLSYEDIVLVVEIFSKQDRLEELHVSVGVLSPQLLTLLATNLPSLETLRLEFDRLSSNIVDVISLPESWIVSQCQNWHLRYLTVEPSTDAFRDFDACERVLRAALPYLKILNVQRRVQ